MPRIIDAITVEYHETLNPKLFDETDEMRLDVRVTLLKSAYAFVEFLDVPGLKIESVQFTGSNASFNYTDFSDCDVHIVLDFSQLPCGELAENFFTTKKTLWNTIHKAVTVKGYSVELYAEDITNPVAAAGIYDLLNGEWIRKPERKVPAVDCSAVKAKMDGLANEMDALCAAKDKDGIDKMFDKLKKMRRAGLANAGEFSTENIAFKSLRNLGYIDKLSAARLAAQDADLTLECPICETPEGGFDRCTVQTVNAFASQYHFQPITRESEIPITGQDVVTTLLGRGLKMARRDTAAEGQTMQQWAPAHRVGTWYVSTEGHAMALINGELIDAEHKGPDGRRIVCAIEFRR